MENGLSTRPWYGPKRVVMRDASSPAALAEAEAIGNIRRLYINKADIMKHGLTEGCLGFCSFAKEKRRRGHSDGYRAALEAEIFKTDEEGKTL